MSTEKPLCSIIVPVYNVSEYLDECIKSLLNLKALDLCEIILVDDGSTDNSGAICDSYAQEHPQLKVIHRANGGLPTARNTGLRAAQGEYIYFVDSDDFVNQNFVECTLAAFHKDPNIDMVQIDLQFADRFGNPIDKVLGPDIEHTFDTIAEYGKKRYFQPYAPTWIIKREFLTRNSMEFDETLKMAEDADFVLRCMFCNPRIHTTNHIFYYYRQRDNSIMTKVKKYSQNYYHLHIAKKLITQFYDQRGSDFPDFIKKRIYKLVLVYLKTLAKSNPDAETMEIAKKDFSDFKKIIAEHPNCILHRPSLRIAKLSLPLYVKMKQNKLV